MGKKGSLGTFTYLVPRGNEDLSAKSFGESLHISGNTGQLITTKQDKKNRAGDSLEDIFCHQCTCESCGKGAHYGYNYPPKVSIIPNSEPCNNQTIDELPQTLPSFDPTCYSGDENSFTYDSKSNTVNESPNVFNPPPQPPTYSYEFCRNDAYYGHDYPLQVLFTYDLELLYINTPSWDRPTICYNYDDDEDCTIEITPILSTKEPDKSLSMGDEHLDTILEMKSDKVIKSSFENLVSISRFSDSNDDSTSIDDDSFSIDDIEYVEASPLDSKLVSLESSSTSLNFLLEETNTFDNSLPESKTFCFDLEDNSSGSTTTRADISLPDYEAFHDDHVKEISSGSTTTHSDFSLYDSFIFDLSINPFPPTDRSDFYEFANELAHIISSPEYDCFSFKNEPNSGDFTIDVVKDTFPTREPRVHVPNVLSTYPTLELN
uniref:Uncharacterized protein n=1 Tax=Tanacetum cinerariifolium TaxID=118510 RepID=A0A6L2MQD6_TANCI|nr:hypothetical protein [Tanacetum cinerariifolium]